MQTVTSGKIQSNFGEIAEMAKYGEPVTITQYGRPTLMLLRYQDGVAALKALAAKDLLNWMDGREASAPPQAVNSSDEQINALIDAELRSPSAK